MTGDNATLTWWGASAVELVMGDHILAIDPYLHPASANIVCLTREDWDHCHEPTLCRIVDGDRFERLLAPPSCRAMSRLDVPVLANAADLGFVPPNRLEEVEPTLTRKDQRGNASRRLGPFVITVVASSEREQPNLLDGFLMHRWRPDDGTTWPAQSGPFVGAGRFSPVGYVIELESFGLTVYHPSDLQEAYDAQRALRGRIDVMLFPSVMLEGVEMTVLNAIRPRYIVPIHHRSDEPGFPIPLEVDLSSITAVDPVRGLPRAGASPKAFRRDRERLHAGHWYASADSDLTRLRSLAPALAEIGCEILIATAGVPIALEPLAATRSS